MNKAVFLKVLLLPCLIGAVRAWADGGDCTYRPLTAEEKTFYGRFVTLRDALPSPASGWRFHDSTERLLAPGYTGIPDKVCKEDLEPSLSDIFYYERIPSEQDQAILQRAVQQAPDPAQLAEVEKGNQRIAELTEQVMAAAGQGDMATVDKLNAELDAQSQHMKQTLEKLYAPQAAIAAELDRDRQASVTITVNGRGADCNGQPRSETINGGLVYHCAYENGYLSSGEVLDPAAARVVVVFGKAREQTQEWPRLDRDQREFKDRMLTITADYDNRQPLVVQNVVVVIDSDNTERVEQLYKGMATDKLAALVNR